MQLCIHAMNSDTVMLLDGATVHFDFHVQSSEKYKGNATNLTASHRSVSEKNIIRCLFKVIIVNSDLKFNTWKHLRTSIESEQLNCIRQK